MTCEGNWWQPLEEPFQIFIGKSFWNPCKSPDFQMMDRWWLVHYIKSQSIWIRGYTMIKWYNLVKLSLVPVKPIGVLTLWLNISVSCRRVVYWHRCCLIISTRSISNRSSSWGEVSDDTCSPTSYLYVYEARNIYIYIYQHSLLVSYHISNLSCILHYEF